MQLIQSHINNQFEVHVYSNYIIFLNRRHRKNEKSLKDEILKLQNHLGIALDNCEKLTDELDNRVNLTCIYYIIILSLNVHM